MRLPSDPNAHLTYCSNIHPGESWEEVRAQLRENLPELKRRLSPDHPFGVGLRLSADAAEQLLEGDRLAAFRSWLDEEGLYLFTMNGFPYGQFHGERVKDEVYKPDWTDPRRLQYSLNLTRILAELLPEGIDGGISTSPVSYKPWLTDPERVDGVFRTASRQLAEVARHMAEIRETTGKELHLDIEPEPDCLIENTEETVRFFSDWLFREGADHLCSNYGYSREDAVARLRDHIRICYDTCHFAVEYEEPSEALEAFAEAGIRIGKVQISAALKTAFGDDREEIFTRLRQFEEDTYLHQVIERREEGPLHHYPDLSEALNAGERGEAAEWRIHFHVPLFVDRYQNLNSTQEDIVKTLHALDGTGRCRHYEIETYTWEVLPGKLKQNLKDSIEREFRWTLEQFETL